MKEREHVEGFGVFFGWFVGFSSQGFSVAALTVLELPDAYLSLPLP